MAYRDSEIPNPLDLFPGGNEAVNTWDGMLSERMRLDDGKPLRGLQELTAFDANLDDEPRLRLEYDRFSPALRDRLKKRN